MVLAKAFMKVYICILADEDRMAYTSLPSVGSMIWWCFLSTACLDLSHQLIVNYITYKQMDL